MYALMTQGALVGADEHDLKVRLESMVHTNEKSVFTGRDYARRSSYVILLELMTHCTRVILLQILIFLDEKNLEMLYRHGRRFVSMLSSLLPSTFLHDA